MNINQLSGLNGQSQMRLNQMKLQQSLIQLASGYRINKAADDAAGLAISEKMRAQTTGVGRAMANTQDGNSLVNVAEGALGEVNNMLTRLKDLSVQASNGIYNDEQRASLNNEAHQIMSEIDRISQATNFNGISLLDGSQATAQQYAVQGAATSEVAGHAVVDMSSMSVYDGTNAAASTFNINGQDFMLADAANYDAAVAQYGDANVIQVAGGSGSLTNGDLQNIATAVSDNLGAAFSASSTGIAVSVGEGLHLQVGDTAGAGQAVTVGIGNMSSGGLGLSGLDLSSATGAKNALGMLNNAIDRVNTTRGGLGATQNRLDHTYNNLAVSRENIMASESRIRDADMAKTLMNYTKNNVLSQTGMAMQAHNQMSMMQVLNLLR